MNFWSLKEVMVAMAEINYAVSQLVSPDGFWQAGYGEGGHIMYAYYVVLV